MGEEKQGFWSRLVSGLTKTRDNIVSGFDSIFNGFSNIDDDFYEEIEEILIMGDIGVNATESIMESLRQKVKENRIKEPSACKELLIHSIKEQMDVGRPPSASLRASSKIRESAWCWRRRTRFGRRREASLPSGRTGPAWK